MLLLILYLINTKYKETSSSIKGLVQCYHSADAKSVVSHIKLDPDADEENSNHCYATNNLNPIAAKTHQLKPIHPKDKNQNASSPFDGITLIYKQKVNQILSLHWTVLA